ncbi:MAG: HEPN domain-containing protein [Prolixibacteraceae bacterium]|nr:HEPN domain-containing protein [Prolixibacteraceae bacterium]
MKQTTKDWFIAAEDDLLAAKKLGDEDRLTNVVAFHCQQCLEKCFKAIIEEQGMPSIKSHDLLRLQLNARIQLSEPEIILLTIINEVYIDARYPGDLGLLPHGKPTKAEVKTFIEFCESLFKKVLLQIGS